MRQASAAFCGGRRQPGIPSFVKWRVDRKIVPYDTIQSTLGGAYVLSRARRYR